MRFFFSVKTTPLIIFHFGVFVLKTSAFIITRNHQHQYFSLSEGYYQFFRKTELYSSYYGADGEDLFRAVHRKEYEMKQFSKEHQTISDPIRVAMSYIQENEPPLRLARALRRVYEDPDNAANPNRREQSEEDKELEKKFGQGYDNSLKMRQSCFVADIKRKSLSRDGGSSMICHFDDAAQVAEAFVQMGADCVFINVDYKSYGGDITELKSCVRRVRKISDTCAVVMKDLVVDEIQIGIAKEAECDGVLLIASVLGPALENFLNLCSVVGIEAIVECHTKNEVEAALDCLAQNILVTNYDRISQKYYPNQATDLSGLFPGSGGPIISLAGGDLQSTEEIKEVLNCGYDGVVVGHGILGNNHHNAQEFIDATKNRVMLPAEFSGWGLEDLDDKDPLDVSEALKTEYERAQQRDDAFQ